LSELHLIERSQVQPSLGCLVFVHGLNGHPIYTWQGSQQNNTFWPSWLADDIGAVDVYSFGYKTSSPTWFESKKSLSDLGWDLLARLERIPQRPLVFICHSLGGLVVKKALQLAEESSRPALRRLVARTRGVVFFATPHVRTKLLDIVTAFGADANLKLPLGNLDNNVQEALDVTEWYRRNTLRLGIDTTSFRALGAPSLPFDTSPFSEASGIPGEAVFPLDADHISIVKPTSRSAPSYITLRDFIIKELGSDGPLIRGPSGDEWPIMPLIHTASGIRARNIIRDGRLSPSISPYSLKLNSYLFYGKPAYISSAGVVRADLCPFCFVFSPDLISKAEAIFPFDTGAFERELDTGEAGRIIQDFALPPEIKSPNYIIAKSYASLDEYIQTNSTFSLIRYNRAPIDNEISHITSLSAFNDGTSVQKISTNLSAIEVVFDSEIALQGNLLSVVVPHMVFESAEILTALKSIQMQGVQIAPYIYVPGKRLEYYGDLIKGAITDLYKMWGVLQ
jgi:hypothetical protein